MEREIRAGAFGGVEQHRAVRKGIGQAHTILNNDRIKLRPKGKSPVQYRALFESNSAS